MISPSAIHRQRFQKVALIFLFSLLSVALVITWNMPATGYESSIYHSTPLILWVSLIASVIAGIALVIVSIAKNELEQNSLWKIGFLLVFLCYTICLALYIIRGYHMWCMTGDPASHIGWTKETINTGHVPTSIIYPITHIYLSEIVFFTGLDLVILHKMVPLIFGLLCVLFMYVLAQASSSNYGGAVLAGVISCCLTFGWYLNLTPNALSNMLIPFALFLTIKFLQKREWAWAVPLSVIIILYPVFHVLPAVVLGLVLLTLWIPGKLVEMIQNLREKKIHVLKCSSEDFWLLFPFLLLLSWFIFWISSFQEFGYTIKDVYYTVALEEETQGAAFLDQISYAQNYGYSVIEQVLKVYGVQGILILLSLLALLVLWREFTVKCHNKPLFSIYGPVFAILFLMGVLFIFNLPFGPLRFIVYISMLGTLFAAYFFSYFLVDRRSENNLLLQKTGFKVSCATVVITLLFLASMFILYPSPYTLGASSHTTQSEVMGMTFFYDHRDVNVPVTGITIAPGRFSHAFLTPEERSVQRLPMYLENQVVPWHFGYDEYHTLSDLYANEMDLIITQKDRLHYVDLFPDMAELRFKEQDFERLDYDPDISLLYSNGGFDLRKVTMMV
ncbi:MAG: hypothetical protein CVV35_01360 [Methanomicrobiales archaeon HGW-Methanomicrobiales-6]|jgi:hypothetical protein|nr:MAG: hypothetical protein CVV35_01360 [Methanomicrobiales archaeon HGW-Methanomicrobiales-6]